MSHTCDIRLWWEIGTSHICDSGSERVNVDVRQLYKSLVDRIIENTVKKCRLVFFTLFHTRALCWPCNWLFQM